MKNPVIQFYTIMDGEVVKQFKCKVEREDGFTSVGTGATLAMALLDAALQFANREKQEFNRAEYDKAEASKRDYSMNAVRYTARRKPPLVLIETDVLMDVNLICGQMRSVVQQLGRANDDWEEGIKPKLRQLIDGVEFMTPEKKEPKKGKNRK